VGDGGADAEEEVCARLVATGATLKELDALAGEEWTRDETVERMRSLYEYRKRRLAARSNGVFSNLAKVVHRKAGRRGQAISRYAVADTVLLAEKCLSLAAKSGSNDAPERDRSHGR
jgi:hypothetical protein